VLSPFQNLAIGRSALLRLQRCLLANSCLVDGPPHVQYHHLLRVLEYFERAACDERKRGTPELLSVWLTCAPIAAAPGRSGHPPLTRKFNAQVHRQIDQMVMFIKQEAEEKANEIRMSAEEVRRVRLLLPSSPCRIHAEQTNGLQEFNLEKLNLLESEKQRIRKEYERKEAQVESRKKMCVHNKHSFMLSSSNIWRHRNDVFHLCKEVWVGRVDQYRSCRCSSQNRHLVNPDALRLLSG
jgi:hypothetical protein